MENFVNPMYLVGPGGRRTVTYDQLKEIVIGIIRDKGEHYRDPIGGRYFDPYNHRPSCLVGEIMHREGLTLQDIPGMNRSSIGGIISVFAGKDAEAIYALQLLQTYNDQGSTWFEAACEAFNMTPTELRAAVIPPKPEVEFDAEGYVNFIQERRTRKTFNVSHAPCVLAEKLHVLAA